MKKIQYTASVMRPADFAALFTKKDTMPGQQAQKYNRLLIEGLAANNVYVQVISGVPVTKQNYPKKVFQGKRVAEGSILYHYLPTLNLMGIKNIVQLLGAFFEVLLSKKTDAVICDVLNASVALGASFAAHLKRKPFVGIVTDHPRMMVTGSGKKYIRMVERVIQNCTHYVFLTEQMNKTLNHKEKPYVIIEGVSDQKASSTKINLCSNKHCIYAGLLDARYGVKKMVDAFILADIEGAELHVYGNGPYVEELQHVASQHHNVLYHGNVLNEEVVAAEMDASLLINPRPTTEEFTKYSFPSKNMEYMASGTPVLTTNLPGMPQEYQEYVYLFDDETVEGMARKIREVLSFSPESLRRKGLDAQRFVLENKNNVVQAKKILTMLEQCSE